jgi:ribosome-associated protein
VSVPIVLPEEEFHWSYARSGGPGGQNVNKVSSKAVLRWDLAATVAVSDAIKIRLTKLFPRFITDAGMILISSQEHRDQERNRDACRAKLAAMIEAARFVPKPRVKSKPTKGSQERRLKAKKHSTERRGNRRVNDE